MTYTKNFAEEHGAIPILACEIHAYLSRARLKVELLALSAKDIAMRQCILPTETFSIQS